MRASFSSLILKCFLVISPAIGLYGQPAKLVSNIAIKIGPSSVTLGASSTQQFKVSITGTKDKRVSWSINPPLGTISSVGLYTAPSSILEPANVVLQVTSRADPTQTATVLITLKAGVSITVGPANATLTASQTQQFTPTIAGTTETGVSWSLSPPVGTVSSSGSYTAPATISTAQNVMLTATSLADATKTALAVIALAVSPAAAPLAISLTAPIDGSQVSGNVGINATVTGSVASVQFYADSNPVGGQLTAAPYTVNWNTATVPDATHTISAMALDAAGNRTTTTINVSVKNAATVSTVTLPIEVMGAAGTTQTVQVNLPSVPAGSLRLWLQIHGLKYQTEASVQVNSGAWMPINDTTVTLLGKAATYGGIGGGFSTLKLTMNLPTGAVVAGTNTVSFRFNGTDGVTSGFRVLNFNFVAPDGTGLLSSSNFVQDNPGTWQAPLPLASDIDAGKQLWSSANLMNSSGSPIRAKCASCHAQDGRDLKYFNYSNNSIRARSMFHGLTSQQGDQIVSYIRSLSTPAPAGARPWNPPYQPGAGMDSKPVSEWAAGAGINAVLDQDSDMLPYLMPNGSTANWAWNAYLNAREIPLSLQLPDWNRWLPTVHPLDAWGDSFTSSTLNSMYLRMRTDLRWQDSTVYSYMKSQNQFGLTDEDFLIPRLVPQDDPTWNDRTYVAKIYSIRLWEVVKLWEINQEFGLEGMARVVFGPQSADRAWYTNKLFFVSPFMTKIPKPSPGIGNGLKVTFTYQSFIWYQVQMLLNDGNGTAAGSWPIDWPYALGYPVQDLTWDADSSTPRAGTAGLLALWLVKALQATGSDSPRDLVAFPANVSAWIEVSTAQKLQVMNGYTQAWLKRNQITPIFPVSDLVFALPQLRYQGVDLGLLTQISTWAQGMWPSYNWTNILNAPCSVFNLGAVVCTPQ